MKRILVAGTCLLMLGTPAFARSPAAHNKRIVNKRVDPRDAEIKALEAKVDALTRRLDEQEAAQKATAEQARAAQAAAVATQAKAETALSQTQAVNEQGTKTAKEVASIEKAEKTGWFANTSISGKSFFNVSNINQKSVDLAGTTTESAQNGTQVELKRFYVSVDHKFNDMFSADITTDFRYNANGLSKDTAVFVKKAYLQAKFNPALTVRIGAADLPWIAFDEGVYGFRFVDPTLIDRTKFGSSVDWGVHVLGSFADNLVSYQVSAIDGQGYKTLSRSSDTLDLEGRINVNPTKNITLAVGGYTGKLGKSAANLPDSATPHTATRFDALAAYTDKRVRAGVEYFAARNWNNVNTAAKDKSDGWSAFGSFAFTPKILAFGRYDWLRPSRIGAPALKNRYFNIGLDYKPISPLDFAFVYKREVTRHGTLATANGIIGGAAEGSYDEFGLFGQFTF
ncbi:MAG TPA: hypothetical protein VNR86_05685 [Sphingomicrobium sp.]|nr:hypothetical protein [Sphingomicrobium sp.]